MLGVADHLPLPPRLPQETLGVLGDDTLPRAEASTPGISQGAATSFPCIADELEQQAKQLEEPAW